MKKKPTDRVIHTFALSVGPVTPAPRVKALSGRIIESEEGILTCSACTNLMCSHIEQVIREGIDTRVHAQDVTTSFAELPNELIVPVVPSHDFWVRVQLSGDADFKAVLLTGGMAFARTTTARTTTARTLPITRTKADILGSISPLVIPLPSLGFLCPGEGRLVIRSMVFEWLKPRIKALRCSSRVHVAQHSRHPNPWTPTGEQWANIWCLATEGFCKVCLTYETDFTQDAPIL